jgi:hypothetical protein
MNLPTLAALLLLAAPERPDLTGRVSSGDAPVPGASVFIYTARPRQGTSTLCPSCYADCGKRAEAGEDGTFRIEALDPGLIFRVLVAADGYRPAFVDSVDPASGPIKAELKPNDLKGLDANRIVRGRVVGPDGEPVAGATVTPVSFWTGAYRGYSPDVFDPLAVTNLRGEFALAANSPIHDLSVKVEARSLAPRIFHELSPAAGPRDLGLTEGASVSGRLVIEGKPVAGAVIGLVQSDRSMGHYLGDKQVGTDAEGRFLFPNVAPNDKYYVYGIMSSLKGRGAVPVKALELGSDGSLSDAGDLPVVPGHRLSGQVLTSDQKPIPPGTRLLVSREQAWDSQSATLDPDGRFELTGLPTERYSLSVRLKGYHLSDRNKSHSPNNPWQLTGLVDQDTAGLKILMEPGDR